MKFIAVFKDCLLFPKKTGKRAGTDYKTEIRGRLADPPSKVMLAIKNHFDLLPIYAFRDKVVSMLVIAGSSKHYLVAEQQLKPISDFSLDVIYRFQ